MNIGEAAAQSGLTTKTIRYYESVGVLKPQRARNGHREFRERDVHHLRLIARARDLGYSLEQCREFLSLYRNRRLKDLDLSEAVTKQVQVIRRKQAEIQSLEAVLDELLAAAAGGNRPAWPDLERFPWEHPGRSND